MSALQNVRRLLGAVESEALAAQIVGEELSEAQVVFRETVQSGMGMRLTKDFFSAGRITQILFHFPPGCSSLVEIKLFKNEQTFYPISGTLALDDATPVYYVDADYYAHEPLTVEVLNKDSQNPHTPSVAVTIRYKRPWWRPDE